jgi:hypothetical protein
MQNILKIGSEEKKGLKELSPFRVALSVIKSIETTEQSFK